jgi:hypothetical protein
MVETIPHHVIPEQEFTFDEEDSSAMDEQKEDLREVSVEEYNQDVEMENGDFKKGKRRGKR